MQRIIIIDDTNCKSVLEDFLKMLRQHVQYDVSIGDDSLHKQLLLECIKEIPDQKKITVKSEGNIYLISSRNITRIEAFNEESVLFLNNHKPMQTNDSIDYWTEKFSDQGFIKVHQNHTVNIHEIVKVQLGEKPFMILSNGDKIPVDMAGQHQIASNIEEML